MTMQKPPAVARLTANRCPELGLEEMKHQEAVLFVSMAIESYPDHRKHEALMDLELLDNLLIAKRIRAYGIRMGYNRTEKGSFRKGYSMDETLNGVFQAEIENRRKFYEKAYEVERSQRTSLSCINQ